MCRSQILVLRFTPHPPHCCCLNFESSKFQPAPPVKNGMPRDTPKCCWTPGCRLTLTARDLRNWPPLGVRITHQFTSAYRIPPNFRSELLLPKGVFVPKWSASRTRSVILPASCILYIYISPIIEKLQSARLKPDAMKPNHRIQENDLVITTPLSGCSSRCTGMYCPCNAERAKSSRPRFGRLIKDSHGVSFWSFTVSIDVNRSFPTQLRRSSLHPTPSRLCTFRLSPPTVWEIWSKHLHSILEWCRHCQTPLQCLQSPSRIMQGRSSRYKNCEFSEGRFCILRVTPKARSSLPEAQDSQQLESLCAGNSFPSSERIS